MEKSIDYCAYYHNGFHADWPGCRDYAMQLWCKPLHKSDPPKAEDCYKAKYEACQKKVHSCEFEQQELRFWKRCGVIKTGEKGYDQHANCDGYESSVEMACNPIHGKIDPVWCSPREKQHWERMNRDGVTWFK